MADREHEAARLRETEHRLWELDRQARAGLPDVASYAGAMEETESMLAETKRLALDAHTMALMRISVAAGGLLARLDRGRRRIG